MKIARLIGILSLLLQHEQLTANQLSASVEFCHRTGLDYVSCSPFRVPIARLAAAQAAIKEA